MELVHASALWIYRLPIFDGGGDFAPEFRGRVALLIFEEADAPLNNVQSPSAPLADYDLGKATGIS